MIDNPKPLRRGIDYIGVGVGAVIVDAEGRLFAALRGAGAKNERGKWEFPGGSVEFGETLAHTLRREMMEEYGVVISVGPLLDVVDHIISEEKQHWVSPTYLCRIVEGTPQIREPAKCSQIGWFNPQDIPSNLSGASRRSLEDYLKYLANQKKTA
jgi:8-oxo-dGTP diphosphatase